MFTILDEGALSVILDAADLFDRLRLAATSNDMRVLLEPFFKEWDMDLARLCGKLLMEAMPVRSYDVKPFTSPGTVPHYDDFMAERVKIPLLHLKYKSGCRVYEHGRIYDCKASYSFSRKRNRNGEFTVAQPKLESCKFKDLKILSKLPVDVVLWKNYGCIDERGVAYVPHIIDGMHVYQNNFLTCTVHMVNPRIKLELTGAASYSSDNFGAEEMGDECHINMSTLNIYVDSMFKRV